MNTIPSGADTLWQMSKPDYFLASYDGVTFAHVNHYLIGSIIADYDDMMQLTAGKTIYPRMVSGLFAYIKINPIYLTN